ARPFCGGPGCRLQDPPTGAFRHRLSGIPLTRAARRASSSPGWRAHATTPAWVRPLRPREQRRNHRVSREPPAGASIAVGLRACLIHEAPDLRRQGLLVGDEAADILLRDAAVLADQGSADTVELRAFGADGQEVVATLLLE